MPSTAVNELMQWFIQFMMGAAGSDFSWMPWYNSSHPGNEQAVHGVT